METLWFDEKTTWEGYPLSQDTGGAISLSVTPREAAWIRGALAEFKDVQAFLDGKFSAAEAGDE